jgi:uncharacterized protein (DUF4415 family)
MRKDYDFSKGQHGSVLSTEGKTHTSIWLDDDVYAFFCTKAQAQGRGYQGLINDALRETMKHSAIPPQESEHS